MTTRVQISKRTGDRSQPGPWWWPLTDGSQKSASVKCPECGLVCVLDHSISDDGTVAPSLVCPEPECSWHVFVQLVGWSP